MTSNGLPSFRKQRDLSMLGNGNRPATGTSTLSKPSQASSGSAAQKPKNLLLGSSQPASTSSSVGNSLFKINVKKALETPVVIAPTSAATDVSATTKPKHSTNLSAEKQQQQQQRGSKRTYVSGTGFFGDLPVAPSSGIKRVSIGSKPKGSKDITISSSSSGGPSVSRAEPAIKAEKFSPRKGEASPSKTGDSKVTAIDLTRLPPFEYYATSNGEPLGAAAEMKDSRMPIRLPLSKSLLSGVKWEVKGEKRTRVPEVSTDNISNTNCDVDRDTDEPIDIKPNISRLGEMGDVAQSTQGAEMFDELDFVLLELPDGFPVNLRDGDRDQRANESTDSASAATAAQANRLPQADTKPFDQASKVSRSTPVGYVEVRESGQCSLVITDATEANLVHRFELNSVADAGFLQEVCLFRPGSEADMDSANRRPEFTKLSAVRKRVLCVPEMASLIELEDS